MPLKAPRQRELYAQMCRAERWSVRALRSKIGSMLYERTALSRKPAEPARLELAALLDEDRLSTDLVLREPYLLDFLGLKDAFQVKHLEAAILRKMERFIMELGSGFAFLARQTRITLDGEDFYRDLLFYQRELRQLVVVKLKLDRFRPEHKGTMQLHLRWLDKYERKRLRNRAAHYYPTSRWRETVRPFGGRAAPLSPIGYFAGASGAATAALPCSSAALLWLAAAFLCAAAALA